MPILEWFTQPNNDLNQQQRRTAGKFASFYRYNTDTMVLVRIRLELGRTRGTGQTKAMYYRNRVIGFSQSRYNEQYRNNFNWETSDRTLGFLNGPRFGNNPNSCADFFTYDVGMTSQNVLRVPGHLGNQVVVINNGQADITLPDRISIPHLRTLAMKCLEAREKIVLTDRNASEAYLSARIFEELGTDFASEKTPEKTPEEES